jgi:hypothetical protein
VRQGEITKIPNFQGTAVLTIYPPSKTRKGAFLPLLLGRKPHIII